MGGFRSRVLATGLVALLALSVLSACGKSAEDVAAPATMAPEPDIASACWTADERVANPEEGHVMQWKTAPEMTVSGDKTYTAEIVTSAGTITVELFAKDAPLAVNNFVCLARAGYYTNVPVHRIVRDFVIQSGDPSGTGAGGPGYSFNDEPIADSRNYVKGTLAMANAGPNTNGSQFFICTTDLSERLPKSYTIFGIVTGGMDIVDTLNSVETELNSMGNEQSSPVDPVMVQSITIVES